MILLAMIMASYDLVAMILLAMIMASYDLVVGCT